MKRPEKTPGPSSRLLAALAAAGTIGLSGAVAAQSARDYISIVGSSTVYPFATVVAEQFGKTTRFKTPKVESTGSGGGLKLFCAGIGVKHPDVANSSRRIKRSEVEQCHANGVTDIIEVKIGYDGIVLASSREAAAMNVSRKEIYLALAREVPDPAGGERLVENPHRTWRDVSPGLPAKAIRVLGPPPTSGTRDAFVELVMDAGCEEFAFIAAMGKERQRSACRSVREDGGYVEAGENDNLIVQKLGADPDAFGVFGFSFLDQSTDKVQGNPVDGVAPTFENIAAGDYPVARPLYFYAKKAHVDTIPGMKAFLAEFTSEKAWGEDGYLADKGLIPMPEKERERFATDVRNLRNLQLAQQ